MKKIQNATQIQQSMRELLGYGLVSGIALCVDAGSLMAFSQLMHYMAAATLSYLLGGFIAYYLSVRFVFAEHRLKHGSSEFSVFILLGLVGLVINNAVISFCISTLALSLIASKFLAAGTTFGCNFLLRKLILFTHKKPGPHTPPVIRPQHIPE